MIHFPPRVRFRSGAKSIYIQIYQQDSYLRCQLLENLTNDLNIRAFPTTYFTKLYNTYRYLELSNSVIAKMQRNPLKLFNSVSTVEVHCYRVILQININKKRYTYCTIPTVHKEMYGFLKFLDPIPDPYSEFGSGSSRRSNTDPNPKQ